MTTDKPAWIDPVAIILGCWLALLIAVSISGLLIVSISNPLWLALFFVLLPLMLMIIVTYSNLVVYGNLDGSYERRRW